ncbi:30S ribosomal protein S20 [Caldithrix abyssi DSM 13497]|uniref:Small ribosomal subunit protein bS20 n=1 Tax=Caldithrix abyssi DSM 13497 TaxID=880073 RepID=H1XVG2_CALAY|nr:30S ribosomal protein S20 [Caldithrix abyssi]APF17638.1 rpsT SSU ribosomal protein S20P [Caldithrix abyssi DSM 13497]EHO41720.1 30S ribosomal protein S20 [Caldithrix abyssi DSM 13497]
MAHHKSAIKRIRTEQKARSRNRYYKRRVKEAIKSVLSSQNKEEALENFKRTVSLLDKLVNKRIFHRNKAANRKAKLARYINSLEQ